MEAIEQIKRDPRVRDAYREIDDGQPSYWIHLDAGWYSPYMDCHTIHEWTIARLRDVFRGIKPCACAECTLSLAIHPIRK